MIIFETERLIVRRWEDADYMDLFDFASNPEYTKFLHFDTYQVPETAKERIIAIKKDYEENTADVSFAIELKSEKRVVGDIKIAKYSPIAGGSVYLGYGLNPKYQGHGYMTEVVKGVIACIFNSGRIKKIIATHDTENVKSGEVMKRAGMTLEGIARKAGDNNYHSRYDVAYYSILEEDFLSQK